MTTPSILDQHHDACGKFPLIVEAISDIQRGIPIVITDSLERENEGDLMIAAEKATPDLLSFFINSASGLMCLPVEKFILDRLEIPMSPTNNGDKFSTPFSVSIDARHDITTGMSVLDRMKTISVLLDEKSTPSDITYPGHMFPLRSHPLLLNGRQGHTEASIQLCKLAGCRPVAVISEIMTPDGTMAKLEDLFDYCSEWYFDSFYLKLRKPTRNSLSLISIDELQEFLNIIQFND